MQPFDAPRFTGCRGTRSVLAGGSGDGFNLTYRGCTDARDLQVDIDIYLEQFPTEDALDYGEALQKNFCCVRCSRNLGATAGGPDGVTRLKCGRGCPRQWYGFSWPANAATSRAFLHGRAHCLPDGCRKRH